ncbi:MAG: response regulator transcription factor [Candidatus Saccharimonadales bacterium]
MTKIMLVEDDKSLREIYGVRLLAEGYDIVSAGDGEEALAIAIKERPALIITDVMMPKISGFDMLDILRSTTETRTIKVIVMTALSSEDQRMRGEQMGADRYLVKSQVGIEDVVRVVHEVLGDSPGVKASPSAPPAQAPPMSPPPPPPAPNAPPRPQPPPASAATAPQQPAMPAHGMPPVRSSAPAAPSTRQRVIQPISDPTKQVDINELLDREMAKEGGNDPNAPKPQVATTAEEKAAVQNQLDTLKQGGPAPTIAIDQQGNVSKPSTPPGAPPQAQQSPAPPPAPRPLPPVPPRPVPPTPPTGPSPTPPAPAS